MNYDILSEALGEFRIKVKMLQALESLFEEDLARENKNKYFMKEDKTKEFTHGLFLETNVILQTFETKVNELDRRFLEISKMFAENPNVFKLEDFLSIFTKFHASLESAMKVWEKEVAKEKKKTKV